MVNKELPRDLAGIQRMLDGIYAGHNRQYYPSIRDLILKLVWSIGIFASAERKGTGSKIPRYLVDTFAWWVAVCSFLNLDVADVLWEKYPGVCIYCGERQDCSCEGRKWGISSESVEHHRRARRRMPRTMQGWQKMFYRIYGKQNARYGLDHALARLPEEITELIECVLPSIKDPDQTTLELADIGARIFSIAVLLEIDLQRILLANYRGVCPGCHKSACGCPPHTQ